MYSLYYSPIARKLGLAKTTDWGVAIRKVSSRYDTILGREKKVSFSLVENSDQYWFADPLLFSDNGKTWLFVEAFNKAASKGEIGYFEINNGKAVNFRRVIDTPTHMSYPFVFKYQNEYYMIPETGAAHHIALYKAKDFPGEWEMDKVLLNNVVYRDTTIIPGEYGFFKVLSYKQEGTNRFNIKNTLTVFDLDMNKKILSKVSEFNDSKQCNRPAGPCFECDGKRYRVAQKCDRAYGEAICVYEVNNDGLFKNDRIINMFDGTRISLPTGGKIVLTHTYSQAGGYEVIDYRSLL